MIGPSICIVNSQYDSNLLGIVLNDAGYSLTESPRNARYIIWNSEDTSPDESIAEPVQGGTDTQYVSVEWLHQLLSGVNERIEDYIISPSTSKEEHNPKKNEETILTKQATQCGWIDPFFQYPFNSPSIVSIVKDSQTSKYLDFYFSSAQYSTNRNSFCHACIAVESRMNQFIFFCREGTIGEEGCVHQVISFVFDDIERDFDAKCKSLNLLYKSSSRYSPSYYFVQPIEFDSSGFEKSALNKQYLWSLPMTPEAAYLLGVASNSSLPEKIIQSHAPCYDYVHELRYNQTEQPLLPLARSVLLTAKAVVLSLLFELDSTEGKKGILFGERHYIFR